MGSFLPILGLCLYEYWRKGDWFFPSIQTIITLIAMVVAVGVAKSIYRICVSIFKYRNISLGVLREYYRRSGGYPNEQEYIERNKDQKIFC
ncbi:hypothetical protein [Psittacicella hinzii]|uniref:Uncharacterized protein n=1 Tax=Psittacicella hinzii TaxID=2028575 RepID=A0A3A1YN90_9GAMM|nr:hypothetical protein [Psittacicella hinzii]RIY37507.1 hypothetical protein CKF58_04875 [Psittacicella hinzii]